MSQGTSWEMRQGLPGEARLGVIDAYRLGWRVRRPATRKSFATAL